MRLSLLTASRHFFAAGEMAHDRQNQARFLLLLLDSLAR